MNEEIYLPKTIRNIYDYVDGIMVNVSLTPYGQAEPIKRDQTEEALYSFDHKLSYGNKVLWEYTEVKPDPSLTYGDETLRRYEVVQQAAKHWPDMTHVMIIDADEGFQPKTLKRIRHLMKCKFDSIRLPRYCFWKNYHYRIDPVEINHVGIVFKLFAGGNWDLRDFVFPVKPKVYVMTDKFYHFSWVRKDNEAIKDKLKYSIHRNQFIKTWYQKIWKGWDYNKDMCDLHPTDPWAYPQAKKFPLDDIPKEYLEIEEFCDEKHCCV